VKVPPMAIGGIVAVVVALGALGLWRAKPRPVVPGTLILNPTPWANVETIVNAQASGPDYARACPTTPCVLPLPPGQYNIRLSGPGFQTVTVAVTVSAGGSRQITQHMTGFDADQAIKDILEKQP
jgi:hypothetical protein